jgi:biotin transporter BioY
MPTGKRATSNIPDKLKDPRFLTGVFFLVALVVSAHVKFETPIKALSISLQTVVLGLACRFLKLSDALKVIGAYILLGALGFDVFSAVDEGIQFYSHRYAGFLLGFILSPFYFSRFKTVRDNCLQDLFFLFLGMHGLIILCGILRMEYPIYSASSISHALTALAPAAILKSVLLALIIRGLHMIPGWSQFKKKLSR